LTRFQQIFAACTSYHTILFWQVNPHCYITT